MSSSPKHKTTCYNPVNSTVESPKDSNIVPFVSVDSMMRLVLAIGIEPFFQKLADTIQEDFLRWENFEKTPRLASHSYDGVIELMPTKDHSKYGFKYVNGHPGNRRYGLQTVAAFGVLADVNNGYPLMISEMTLLTALRTAATSALAAKYLAPAHSKTMALIGNGAQAEFQAIAFKALMGITDIRLYDLDPEATKKCCHNLAHFDFQITACTTIEDVVAGADILTTITADKRCNTILTDNNVGSGTHINAVGGDCPGKTELHQDILKKSDIFVEFTEQTRIEGEIQQLDKDYPVTELWEVIAGNKQGRRHSDQITLFDSVGFAIEDFSALRFVYENIYDPKLETLDPTNTNKFYEKLDMIADPDDPRDLFGMILRKERQTYHEG